MERDGKKIGYISISLFSDTSYDQFKNEFEIQEILQKNCNHYFYLDAS